MSPVDPLSSSAPSPYRFADLMTKLGHFMFYWSLLEQELTESIIEARAELNYPMIAVRGALTERLDVWFGLVSRLPENKHQVEIADQVRVQASELRKVRNDIVHGLQGGSAMPPEGRPFIECRVGKSKDRRRKTVVYTIDQLEDFAEGIDACRRAFKSLEAFNHRIGLPIAPT